MKYFVCIGLNDIEQRCIWIKFSVCLSRCVHQHTEKKSVKIEENKHKNEFSCEIYANGFFRYENIRLDKN